MGRKKITSLRRILSRRTPWVYAVCGVLCLKDRILCGMSEKPPTFTAAVYARNQFVGLVEHRMRC